MLATLTTLAVVTHPGPWAAGFGWVFFLIPLFWFTISAHLFANFVK